MTGEQPVDVLDRVIAYLDAVRDLADRREVPAYAETCPCGGSVEVGQATPAAERHRIHAQFVGRHYACTKREVSS